MPLTRLIYASRPFGFDDLALSSILATARLNNARDGVTGALVCREDVYLQFLEGPIEAVTSTYARIVRDDRHTDIALKLQADAEARLFPDWAMRHDPAQSWLWTREQVSAGAVDNATSDETLQIFVRLASQPAATGPGGCPMSLT
ncbi:MAG: BLUF domain-containing protein [Hyphomicrobium sp.]